MAVRAQRVRKIIVVDAISAVQSVSERHQLDRIASDDVLIAGGLEAQV